jgi:hypothetical protein
VALVRCYGCRLSPGPRAPYCSMAPKRNGPARGRGERGQSHVLELMYTAPTMGTDCFPFISDRCCFVSSAPAWRSVIGGPDSSRNRIRGRKPVNAVWAEHRSLAEDTADTTDLDCRFPHYPRASPNIAGRMWTRNCWLHIRSKSRRNWHTRDRSPQQHLAVC